MSSYLSEYNSSAETYINAIPMIVTILISRTIASVFALRQLNWDAGLNVTDTVRNERPLFIEVAEKTKTGYTSDKK